MEDEPRAAIGRRAVLAAAAGGAAALAAQSAAAVIPDVARAADGDKVSVGQNNEGTKPTWVSSAAASPSLGGNSTSGDGIRGESGGTARSGVYGTNSAADGYGVFGRNLATNVTGALATPDAGAEGWHPFGSTSGALATKAAGVEGRYGMFGASGALGSPTAGVRATGTKDVPALVVDGTASFRRCGVAVVPAGKSSVRVTGLTFGPLAEYGLAMLQAYRAGVAVAATVVDAKAGTVTIHLTKTVPKATPVTWYLFAPIAYFAV